MLLVSITAAQKSIRIANAYFVPDDLCRRTLVEALHRGVQVEIITPGPDFDAETVRSVGKARWQPLLETGARFYRVPGRQIELLNLCARDLWSLSAWASHGLRSIRRKRHRLIVAFYKQAELWPMTRRKAGSPPESFEAIARDLRKMLRLLAERRVQPSAAIIDGRTVQSTPESGARAGYDGYKRRKGSKVHAAVDTLGHLLALKVTPANESERDQVGALASQVQAATGDHVEIFYADQGYTGEVPKAEAAGRGIELVVVKLAEAKRGFVLLPKRWVVERSFAWAARFRRLARDYERLPNHLRRASLACLSHLDAQFPLPSMCVTGSSSLSDFPRAENGIRGLKRDARAPRQHRPRHPAAAAV